MTQDNELLERITVRSDIFGGKPIIRGMRFAVEHVLAKLAAGNTVHTLLSIRYLNRRMSKRACSMPTDP